MLTSTDNANIFSEKNLVHLIEEQERKGNFLFVIDVDFKNINYFSEKLDQFLGIDLRQLFTDPLHYLFNVQPMVRKHLREKLKNDIQNGHYYGLETFQVASNQGIKSVQEFRFPIKNDHGEIVRMGILLEEKGQVPSQEKSAKIYPRVDKRVYRYA